MSNPENQPERNQSQAIARAAESLGRSALENVADDEHSFQYELLQLEHNPERSKQLRRSYVYNTMRLVEKIERTRPDYIVFLDKSARPVSWLLKELWTDLAGEDSDLPEFRYLNIDRKQWQHKVGGREIGNGMIRFDQVKHEIKVLRDLFTLEQDRDKPPEEQITLFSDKRVLVVDELRVTGSTLQIARGFLKEAFPDAAEIFGHAWMDSKAARRAGLPDIPVWYSKKDAKGRGVDDRSAVKSRKSKSATQRRGWMFLSTGHEGRDAQAQRFRDEFKRLAYDWRTDKLGTD